jgi:hypothetical protein
LGAGHWGHTTTGSGFGDKGVQPGRPPAATTIATRTNLSMWVIYIEILLALALAAFIVWWTWPKNNQDDRTKND